MTVAEAVPRSFGQLQTGDVIRTRGGSVGRVSRTGRDLYDSGRAELTLEIMDRGGNVRGAARLVETHVTEVMMFGNHMPGSGRERLQAMLGAAHDYRGAVPPLPKRATVSAARVVGTCRLAQRLVAEIVSADGGKLSPGSVDRLRKLADELDSLELLADQG